MTQYTDLRGRAALLLAGKGRAMTLRKRTSGAYSHATGAAAVAEADYETYGAQFAFPALLIDGTRIQVGDMKVLLAAEGLSVEPDIGDQLLIGGAVWNIVAPAPIGPDGTVVVWKLQVRR